MNNKRNGGCFRGWFALAFPMQVKGQRNTSEFWGEISFCRGCTLKGSLLRPVFGEKVEPNA
jgi:hypothetical protein